MSSGSQIATHPYIVNSLGYAFIGWTLELVGYGLCLQSAGVLINSRRLTTRPLVILYILMTLLSAITGITIWCIFYWGTLELRTEKAVDAFTLPSAVAPIPTGMLAFIVQAFFAERALKVVDRSRLFLVLIAFLMIVSFGGSVGRSAALLMGIIKHAEPELLLGTSATWNFASALADVAISGVLIYGLAVRKTGYNTPTDNIVARLINLALQTAGLPTFFALGSAISAVAARGTNVSGTYCLFILALPSIYVYSFLWCILSTEALKQQTSVDLASGCDRCRGWLAPIQEQAILASPALNAHTQTPTLGYFGQPVDAVTRSRQQQSSRDQTVSLVDFWQALRGRESTHTPHSAEAMDRAIETASTAGSSSAPNDKKEKEEV